MVRRKAAAHAVAPHAVGARLQCTRSDGQPPCARAPICTRRAHARSPAPIAPQLRRLLLRRRVHASRRCRTGVCEVLERREDSGGNGGYEYYVHYTDLNRRLDEWVSHGRLAPVERSANAARKRLRHELQALQPARVLPVGEPDGPDGLDHVTLKEHEAATKVKNVGAVVLGRWRMEAWYYSPLICLGNSIAECAELHMCEFCLHGESDASALAAHSACCSARHPPGDEIYRDGALSVFEVDGREEGAYCSRLCVLAKLFLDHKVSVGAEAVAPFRFYVLTAADARGCRLLGYFSKEKLSVLRFNLACILVLPPHQRKGYGTLLISLSYELSRREGERGTPERPLSDLGLRSYRRFWAEVLLRALHVHAREGRCASVEELAEATAIREADVVSTLQAMGVLVYTRGQHFFRLTPALLAEYVDGVGGAAKPPNASLLVDPAKLEWQPPTPAVPTSAPPKAGGGPVAESAAAAGTDVVGGPRRRAHGDDSFAAGPARAAVADTASGRAPATAAKHRPAARDGKRLAVAKAHEGTRLAVRTGGDGSRLAVRSARAVPPREGEGMSRLAVRTRRTSSSS